MKPGAAAILVCPDCRGALAGGTVALTCGSCGRSYSVEDGIPCLYPPGDHLTISAPALRVKTKDEAARTIADMVRMDSGFIRHPRAFYALYAFLLLFLLMGWKSGAFVILFLMAVDWVTFRARRARILARYAGNPLRLRTVADHEAVDRLYEREGKDQPNMSDWVRLAREAVGGAAGADVAPVQDDERYADIAREYEASAVTGGVVLDVGCNDGRAYVDFGVGRGATFIGVDVSRLLLKAFLERIPDQTAVQADGLRLPIKEASVDFLFCTETLEHIADPGGAMLEFMRVLKPGGRLIVQSPNAHRLRNLNVFHMATLAVSLVTDRVLQKKSVHENTWHNAVTYHWDFSVQDYRRMARAAGARVIDIRSRAFFFPEFLIRGDVRRFQRKERVLSAIPVIRRFGGDAVLVAAKP